MNKIICFAVSLSGHDRGEIFAVCWEDENYCFLADGKGRTLQKPKKKNRKHVQFIRRIPKELMSQAASAEHDSDVVHLLRLYKKLQSGNTDAGMKIV